MPPLIIHPVWQFLLLIVAIPVFSLISLLIGLYIQAGRKDERKIIGRSLDESSRKPPKTPEIMGTARQPERQSMPNDAMRSQTENRTEKAVTFAREIPNAELDQVFGTEETDEIDFREDPDPDEDEVDWQDEETDLQAHRSTGDDDFATGATFGELSRTADLLQKAELHAHEQKIVLDLAERLQQTDLWEKFTDAIPQANEKIAKMLDTSPRTVKTAEDYQSFDIRNFV